MNPTDPPTAATREAIDWTKPEALEVVYMDRITPPKKVFHACDPMGPDGIRMVYWMEDGGKWLRVSAFAADGDGAGYRIRPSPAAPAAEEGVRLPSGEVAKVGDITFFGGDFWRIESLDPVVARAWWPDKKEWSFYWTTSVGQHNERLATAAEIARTTIPLDDVKDDTLRAEVARLRDGDEAFVPTPANPVEGVTLWNHYEHLAQIESTNAIVQVDGDPVCDLDNYGAEYAIGSDLQCRFPRLVRNVRHTDELLTRIRDRIRAERAARLAAEQGDRSPLNLTTTPPPEGKGYDYLGREVSPSPAAPVGEKAFTSTTTHQVPFSPVAPTAAQSLAPSTPIAPDTFAERFAKEIAADMDAAQAEAEKAGTEQDNEAAAKFINRAIIFHKIKLAAQRAARSA